MCVRACVCAPARVRVRASVCACVRLGVCARVHGPVVGAGGLKTPSSAHFVPDPDAVPVPFALNHMEAIRPYKVFIAGERTHKRGPANEVLDY